MLTAIHRRVEALRASQDPSLVCRMPSGWLVMGEAQFLRGYCLLLPDPVVPHLNALQGAARAQFLADMSRAGDALLSITKAVRINYEMLGNLEPALHAHLFPRYDTESLELKTKPVWFYDWQQGPKFDPSRDHELQKAIRAALGTT